MENENNEGAEILARLQNSFANLEQAIEGAKSNLKNNVNVPESVLQRLESYTEILERQKNLAKEMESFVNNGNISEVTRHIGLINGLSGMIIDDARGLLGGLTGNFEQESSEDLPFC